MSDPVFADADQEPEEFEYEGFFTHHVCPRCGYNDWSEGDLRGDDVACDGCGFAGKVASQ